ncbi:MAG: hypothetical protein ABL912_01720 [Novosphingobium sp.]
MEPSQIRAAIEKIKSMQDSGDYDGATLAYEEMVDGLPRAAHISPEMRMLRPVVDIWRKAIRGVR